MKRSRAVWLALVAGCYSPRAPEGAPCATERDCPSPQRCVLGSCSLRDGLIAVDAAIGADASIDAAVVPIDAPPDAAVLPCTATGLACGGATLVFTCGGHCWVRCNNGATWPQASQVCGGWMGTLGRVDDPAEQSCLAAQVQNDSWIGLLQLDTATAPAQGWTWTTAANPVMFTSWQSGVPDDADDRENRAEQCGKIQSGDKRWDDIPCSQDLPYFCER